MDIEKIREEALHLPPEQKVELIDALWESLWPVKTRERELAWAEEAERRIDAVDQGKIHTSDSDEVLARLRNTLRS